MKYKLSQYHVLTEPGDHQPEKKIVFGTRKAKALVIDNKVYDRILNNLWSEISEATLDQLKEVELIVPSDEDELKTVIDRNKEAILNSKDLYYVIQPTAMCQLGCGYCGQKHSKDYLSKPSSAKIIQRIEDKLKVGDYTSLSIGWFGSEPLVGLSQMREMTPKLIALAEKYNCAYSSKVVTNGLSLKENIYIELVNKHKVKSIEVTLDGIAEYHDKRRHTKDGLSTFKIIFENLLRIFNRPDFKEFNCGISIRCNVDINNHEGVVPLIHLLAQNNLQDKISYFYVAPIHSWGNDAHLQSLSKEEIADLQIDWILELYKLGFKPGLLPSINNIVCLSVTPNAEVIDSFGNVFDCTEVSFVPTYENTEFVLGNINNDFETISKRRPLLGFNDDVLSGSLPCSTCEMLPVCGGSCPKSWKEGIAPCPINKYNIKDKLKIQYALVNEGKEGFLSLINQTVEENSLQYL